MKSRKNLIQNELLYVWYINKYIRVINVQRQKKQGVGDLTYGRYGWRRYGKNWNSGGRNKHISEECIAVMFYI